MTRREVIGRYRGSVLGIVWSFLTPLLMLAIYTFVFSFVLKARWGAETGSKTEFALFLFAGLIVHGLFAECVVRAPSLILSNPNYVKKVVFPLEMLPWVSMGSVLIHSLLSVIVLLTGYAWIYGGINWTVVFLPLILAPLIVFTMGVSWFLASLGTYVRDIGQLVNIAVTVLLFMSPIFYPASVLPKEIRPLLFLNPLTFIIEQVRDVVVVGNNPAWFRLGAYALVSLCVAQAGFSWFQKTRRGFADVL
ncbi:MAG: ABC transporter permease [Betaproteobacteria bacterium]|nr:ABC transporter permease [Betaproteobacteria bacterium]MBL8534601.1 ABC transporter permease [Betaproteobacteria bacterium]